MKKKNTIRYGLLVAFAICLITGVISGGYAKYASEKSASDMATVARWSFNVNNKNIAKENFTFDLFKDTDIIAPGSSGNFTLNLENTSDVKSKYSINFDVINNGVIPVVFSLDNDTWYPDIDSINDVKLASKASDNVTIYWKWDAQTDEQDTSYGTAEELATVTVSAKVTAIQDLS